ncbi:hypothetical protein [Burkholderia sp. MSMB1072]|uniref:hypothetical protein n=1 Tax=Burkholderia sp. MSMB1072 TaxID=1637871 RepID=UPI000AFBB6A6|nr:hypothetical protein [Burkholderia sp. MSMB1072]
MSVRATFWMRDFDANPLVITAGQCVPHHSGAENRLVRVDVNDPEPVKAIYVNASDVVAYKIEEL